MIDLIVDVQVALVGLAEAAHFALFLGEGLDHAYARDGVGQHIGDFRPHPIHFLEAMAQVRRAHRVDHPADERQRHQRHQRQPGLMETGITVVMQNHQARRSAKSSRCSDRKMQMRSVSLRDAGDQIARMRLPPKYA